MTDLKVLSGHWRVEFGHQSMLKQHALLQRCGRLTERCDHSSSGHFFRLIPSTKSQGGMSSPTQITRHCASSNSRRPDADCAAKKCCSGETMTVPRPGEA